MVTLSTIRNIIGIIGNIISFGLYLSPLPTIINIHKNKSVQEFKVDPYIATILSCVMWIIYGLPYVNPDHSLVLTIGVIGLVLELLYVGIFLWRSQGFDLTRKKIAWGLSIEGLFTFVVAMTTFYAFHTIKTRTIFVGALCVALHIIFGVRPLIVIKQVFTIKSVKHRSFWLTLTNFLNGVCWTPYVCIKFDIWLVVPNGWGALCGIVQLALYAYYYKTTKWDDDDQSKGSSKWLELKKYP